MEVEKLFENFQYQDLRWFIPVLAGLFVIVGAILVALIRNFNAGVIVALLFGGLMTMSPVILDALQKPQNTVARETGRVAQSAAELPRRSMERWCATCRGWSSRCAQPSRDLHPWSHRNGPGTPTRLLPGGFVQSLSDMNERLDAATNSVERINTMRANLEADLDSFRGALRRADGR